MSYIKASLFLDFFHSPTFLIQEKKKRLEMLTPLLASTTPVNNVVNVQHGALTSRKADFLVPVRKGLTPRKALTERVFLPQNRVPRAVLAASIVTPAMGM